jgi:hypothetical protein
MTDRRMPNATDRWRAMVDALEDIALAGFGERGADAQVDAAAAAEVRRLIRLRVAAQQRRALPADWASRPGIAVRHPPDAQPAPKMEEPPRERAPRLWLARRD